MAQRVAEGRKIVMPDEVVGAVLFLCSSAAAAVTGATVTVAGGEI